MRIHTEYPVNKTHSHRSRQAAAPHPLTWRQVGDITSLKKCFIIKSVDPPGRTILHNMLINVFITQSMQVQCTRVHLDDVSNCCLFAHKLKR